MNVRHIQLAERLSKILDAQGEKIRVVTISTPSVNIAIVNLLLLKAWLEYLEKQGVFVTIDRPHQYIEHLLKMHEIDYSKLAFIDMASSFGGDIKDQESDSATMCGPFSPMDLLDLIRITGLETPPSYLDLLRFDFILLDNINSLMMYNSHDLIKKFLQSLLKLIREADKIFIAFVMDPRLDKRLFDDLSKQSDTCLDIDKNMDIVIPQVKMNVIEDKDFRHSNLLEDIPIPRRI